jgi:NTP pyrophosphatase (non-canonical NTP hydrolase)
MRCFDMDEKKKKRVVDRRNFVVLKREEGMTWLAIGELLGVSKERARQLYSSEMRVRQGTDEKKWYVGLSVRASNCCRNMNLSGREQVEGAIKSGRLHPKKRECKNLGWKTYCEIHEWLGLPMPKRNLIPHNQNSAGMSGNAFINEIVEERHQQDKKWGEQNHHPYKWLAILGEEVGESNKAVLEGSLLDYRGELVQVAAVALAAIECLDRGKWRQDQPTKI